MIKVERARHNTFCIMRSLLRDIGLSYCPASVRTIHRVESTVRAVHIAIVSGLIQAVIFAVLSAIRYHDYLLMRATQWNPVLAGAGERVEMTAIIVVTLEYFLYPLSLLLLYFALEGIFRFCAGLCTADIVPTLPAFLWIKFTQWREQKKERQRRFLLPDVVEITADGRVRIESCFPKPSWNSSITIGLQETWYEVEKAETAPSPRPRPYIYWLRKAPTHKILRGYEEYEMPNSSRGS